MRNMYDVQSHGRILDAPKHFVTHGKDVEQIPIDGVTDWRHR